MSAKVGANQQLQDQRIKARFEREWQRAQMCLMPFIAAERMWERILTNADRKRLGDDLKKAYQRYGNAVGMWMELRGVTCEEAILQVAVQLGFLSESNCRWFRRELGIIVDDPERAMEKAIADGHLVIVESSREVYWAKKVINLDWHRHDASWDLLWALCKRGKSRQIVDRIEFGDSKHVDYVSKQKYRLVNTHGFPLDLADQIVAAGRGTVRLNLPPEKIRVFEQNTSGGLREWLP